MLLWLLLGEAFLTLRRCSNLISEKVESTEVGIGGSLSTNLTSSSARARRAAQPAMSDGQVMPILPIGENGDENDESESHKILPIFPV